MNPPLFDDEARAEQPQDLNELIEKGFLLLGSLQFQIQEHLLANGTRLPSETRCFLAQVRDTAGEAATASRVGAQERVAAVGHDAPRHDAAGADAGAGDAARGEGLPAVREAAPDVTDPPAGGRRRAGRRSLLGMAAPMAAGVLAGFLAAEVFLDAGAPSGPAVRLVSPGTGVAGLAAGEAAPARRPGGAPAATTPDRQAPVRLAVHRPGGRGGPGAYPGPRASGPPLLPPAGPDAAAMAAAEQALAPSPGARREIQRRLRLAGFDPKAVDGIVGPDTRAAIAMWQEAAGLRPTGFLAPGALAALVEETEAAYRGWRRQVAARRAAEASGAVATAPLPPEPPERGRGCRRDASGRIVYGTGVRCDFARLRQTLAGLFGGGRERSRDVARAEREPHRDGA